MSTLPLPMSRWSLRCRRRCRRGRACAAARFSPRRRLPAVRVPGRARAWPCARLAVVATEPSGRTRRLAPSPRSPLPLGGARALALVGRLRSSSRSSHALRRAGTMLCDARDSQAAVYWTWGGASAFAREHFYAEVRAGGASPLRVSSPPGEQWLVRRASRPGEGAFGAEPLLLDVTAAAAPATQRHTIVLPPRATEARKK